MSKYTPCNPDKGEKNGSCNIRSCQRPGATWYNFVTNAYYCGGCARTLNDANRRSEFVRVHGHDMILAPWHHKYPREPKEQPVKVYQ